MHKGFTLLEMMVALGIIILLAAVTVPFYNQISFSRTTESARGELTSVLRLAASQASASQNDSAFGVYILSNHYILFRGNSYASRIAVEDRSFDLPAGITLSGLNEVVFAKQTGLPNVTGTISLINQLGQTMTVSINSQGLIY